MSDQYPRVLIHQAARLRKFGLVRVLLVAVCFIVPVCCVCQKNGVESRFDDRLANNQGLGEEKYTFSANEMEYVVAIADTHGRRLLIYRDEEIFAGLLERGYWPDLQWEPQQDSATLAIDGGAVTLALVWLNVGPVEPPTVQPGTPKFVNEMPAKEEPSEAFVGLCWDLDSIERRARLERLIRRFRGEKLPIIHYDPDFYDSWEELQGMGRSGGFHLLGGSAKFVRPKYWYLVESKEGSFTGTLTYLAVHRLYQYSDRGCANYTKIYIDTGWAWITSRESFPSP